MDRKILLHSAFVVVMAAALIAIAIVRGERSHLPVPQPARVPASQMPARTVLTPENLDETPRPRPETNPEKLPAALHDSTLKGLIQNARVAELRGDTKTRDAMVRGLKKHPDRSKELIQQEIGSSRDVANATALQRLMEALQ